MNRKDEIKSAYKGLGNAHSFYDGMMLGTTVRNVESIAVFQCRK